MPRLIVVDGGGVSRQIKRLPVVDSGGVTRETKKLYAVDAGGTTRLVFQLATFNAGPGGMFNDTASTAFVTLSLHELGIGEISTSAGVSASWDWVSPRSAHDPPKWARVVVTNGAFSSGDQTDTWITVGDVGRTWSVLSQTTGTVRACDFTLELGFTSGIVETSENYEFTATGS